MNNHYMANYLLDKQKSALRGVNNVCINCKYYSYRFCVNEEKLYYYCSCKESDKYMHVIHKYCKCSKFRKRLAGDLFNE